MTAEDTSPAFPARGAPSERVRLVVGAIVGLAVGVTIAWLEPWQLSTLAGWDAMALVVLGWVWLDIAGLDSDQTRRVAVREDNSLNATRLLLLLASTVSLVGVLLAFLKARDLNGGVSVALTLFGVATVIISWLLVHTLFTLRYAHLYYRAEPGGIDFKTGDDHPDYGDFAYVAFTVGMTFQVSDTDVTDPMIRRTVLRHALLAFVFGTIIVAMSINIIAGLVR